MQLRLKYLITTVVVLLIVILGGMSWHQHTHFNRNVTINGVPVGGMTAQQAYSKVKNTKRANKVYLNGQLIYRGNATSSGISSRDRGAFERALKKQVTFFPSGKQQNLLVWTDQIKNDPQSAAKRQAVVNRTQQMNRGKRAQVDAYAVLEHGQVKLVAGKAGNQYDQADLLRQFKQRAANGTVRLTAHRSQPLSTKSATVQNEKKQLQKLTGRSVQYKVENKEYHFTSAGVISKATYQNGKYQFDTAAVNGKIKQINRSQATLGRAFKFKTHAGNVITTNRKGSYGWKISPEKAGQTLAQALADGKKEVSAAHDIYGIGYNTRGTGYGVTSNDGLGDTYAELSISDQHAWFYRDGKCVFDADVVTGANNPEQETPKGVWYIMYQQSPSVLRGKNSDGSNYASKVQYWSQFTDSGCGFHDASWRKNWSKTAYLSGGNVATGGSHGCANMHPSDAGTAYHDLQVNEPVIVY